MPVNQQDLAAQHCLYLFAKVILRSKGYTLEKKSMDEDNADVIHILIKKKLYKYIKCEELMCTHIHTCMHVHYIAVLHIRHNRL